MVWDPWMIGGLALGLSADACTVAIGIGLRGVQLRTLISFALLVAFFHVCMPWGGTWIGTLLGRFVGEWAGPAVALLFVGLGLREIWTACQPARDGSLPAAKMTVLELVLLAFGVSLDALTVGVGLGTLGVMQNALYLGIGAAAGLMSFGGSLLGRHAGQRMGGVAQVAGGLLLLVLGGKLWLGMGP
ncbi:manganese efflux pump MntP family protein [Heliophilum fasciatum]|uniref:Putative Mn2+ efflux pump MntP n=1 Tax=Heliophilum fasciatum TaxID=35700 RepID=A0A4R2RMK4_9FIRM|nr:manganese efflux pump [Heliophilum fasciatum]MCW2277489.1 putative Mn2+ efflux pump MntP [Heliophilum fasciatum]TCP65220.1 putative Mn2+ efflux pump MntP [Heliophilum fasciatum]